MAATAPAPAALSRAAAEALEGRVLFSLSAQVSGPPTVAEGANRSRVSHAFHRNPHFLHRKLRRVKLYGRRIRYPSVVRMAVRTH
jgi:hypothetical protein